MTRHPDLLTAEEAGEYLGVSRSWLYRGNGPPKIRFGAKVMYRKSACDAFIASCEENACSTEEKAQPSGGVDSGSAAKKSAGAQARQIAKRLRSELGASALRSSSERGSSRTGKDVAD